MSLIATLQELLDASEDLLSRVDSVTVVFGGNKTSLSAIGEINKPFVELSGLLDKAKLPFTDASGLTDDLASEASDLCYALEGQGVSVHGRMTNAATALNLGAPVSRLRFVTDLVRGISRDENGWAVLSPITTEVRQIEEVPA